MASQNTKPSISEAPRLKGIGGWLILPLLGLALQSFNLTAGAFLGTGMLIQGGKTWLAIGQLAYFPAAAMSIWALILLLQQKKLFKSIIFYQLGTMGLCSLWSLIFSIISNNTRQGATLT